MRPRWSALRAAVDRSPGDDPQPGFVSAGVRGRERYRRAGLTAASALGARGLTLILSLITVPLTLGYLGPERYGLWLTISSLIALLGFSDLGIANGLLNLVTQALARDRPADARRAISTAFVLLTLMALALALFFAAFYPVIPWASLLGISSPEAGSEAGPAVAMMVACFLIGLPLSAVAQVRIARQEGYVVHLTAAAGNLAAVGALLVVIAAQLGLPYLVAAMAGPPLVASAINGAVLFRHDARALGPSPRLADLATGRTLLRTGFLFFVLQMAMTVAFASDTLVVAQIVGPVGVAEYGVTFRLFLIPTALVALAVAPLWPAYGEAITRGDLAWTRSTFKWSLRVAVLISVPIATGLVLFGLPIIQVWVGGAVRPPELLLVGFGIWVVMSAVGNSVAMLLNGAHEIRLQAVTAAVMAAVNLALSIWLTSRIGVAGVVFGTVIAYGAFVLVPMGLYVPGVLRRIESRHRSEGAVAR